MAWLCQEVLVGLVYGPLGEDNPVTPQKQAVCLSNVINTNGGGSVIALQKSCLPSWGWDLWHSSRLWAFSPDDYLKCISILHAWIAKKPRVLDSHQGQAMPGLALSRPHRCGRLFPLHICHCELLSRFLWGSSSRSRGKVMPLFHTVLVYPRVFIFLCMCPLILWAFGVQPCGLHTFEQSLEDSGLSFWESPLPGACGPLLTSPLGWMRESCPWGLRRAVSPSRISILLSSPLCYGQRSKLHMGECSPGECAPTHAVSGLSVSLGAWRLIGAFSFLPPGGSSCWGLWGITTQRRSQDWSRRKQGCTTLRLGALSQSSDGAQESCSVACQGRRIQGRGGLLRTVPEYSSLPQQPAFPGSTDLSTWMWPEDL